MKYLLITFILAGSLLQALAQERSPRLKLADKAFSTRSFDEAIYQSLLILADNPSQNDELSANWHCAISYYNLNLYREALHHYIRTSELSKSETAFNNLGGFSAQMGYDRIAVKAFADALSVDSTSALAYSSGGGNDLFYGRLESAEKKLEKALEIDSTLSAAYMNQYILYDLQGKKNESLKALQKFKSLLPSSPLPLHVKDSEMKTKKTKEAKRKTEQAIVLYTTMLAQNRYASIVLNRGDLYRDLGKKDLARKDHLQALAIYDQAVADLPDSWRMLLIRGEIYGKLGEYEKGLADLKRVAAMNPAYPTIEKMIDWQKKKLAGKK